MEKFKWANYTRPLTDEEKKTGMLNLSIGQQVEIKNYCRRNEVAEFLAENHDERAFEKGVLQAASEIVDDQEESNISEDEAVSYYLDKNEIEDRELAIKNIEDFCKNEYGSEADVSNLKKIPLAYTEVFGVDDEYVVFPENIPIQVNADLINHTLEYEINNEHVHTDHYDDVQDMNINVFEYTSFDDLVRLDDFTKEEMDRVYHIIYDVNCEAQKEFMLKNLEDDGKYISGTIKLDCYEQEIPFDYNKNNENFELHQYSNTGRMTGSCYEVELSPFLQANWSKIFDDVSVALNTKQAKKDLSKYNPANKGNVGKEGK